MRRRVLLSSVVLLLLVVISAVLLIWRDPKYAGIRLSVALQRGDRSERSPLEDLEPFLNEIDPRGVAILGKYVIAAKEEAPARYTRYYRMIPKQIRRFLRTPQTKAMMARKALAMIETLGDRAIPAVPDLASAVADTNLDAGVAEGAAECLGKLGSAGEAGIPALSSVLSNLERTTRLRMAAAKSLAELGGAACNAMPALLVGLNDPIASIRQSSVCALGNTGSLEIVRKLKEAVATEPPWLSLDYAEAIWKLDKSESNFVVSVLQECRSFRVGSRSRIDGLLGDVAAASNEK